MALASWPILSLDKDWTAHIALFKVVHIDKQLAFDFSGGFIDSPACPPSPSPYCIS